MATPIQRTKRRLADQAARKRIADTTMRKQRTVRGNVIAPNLVQVRGAYYDAEFAGATGQVTELVNVGRASRAFYRPTNASAGGGNSALRSAGAGGSNGGTQQASGTIRWEDIDKRRADLADIPTRLYQDLNERAHDIISEHIADGAPNGSVIGPIGGMPAYLPTTSDGDTNPDTILRSGGNGDVKLRVIQNVDYQAPNPFTDGFKIAPLPGQASRHRLNIGRIEADELVVKVFTADETRVRRGSDWLTQTYGVLTKDEATGTSEWTLPANGGSVNLWFEDSVHFAGALFDNNEWVLLEFVRRDTGLIVLEVWGQVSGYYTDGSHPDAQRWTFTNRTSVPGGLKIKAGAMFMGFGQAGDGWIYRTTLGGGPRTKFVTWTGTNPRDGVRTTQVQIGDLSDAPGQIYDDLTGKYGLWAKDAVYIEGAHLAAGGGDFHVNEAGVNIRAGTLSSANLSDHSDKITFTTDPLDPGNGSTVFQIYGQRYEQTPGNYLADAHITAMAGGTTGNYGSRVTLEALGVSTRAFVMVQDSGGNPSVVISAMQGMTPSTVEVDGDLLLGVGSAQLLPAADSVNVIGDPNRYFAAAYIRDVYADTFHGPVVFEGTITGNQWAGDGTSDMTINVNSAGNRTLHISNLGAGGVSLEVGGSTTINGGLTVTGLINNVDLPQLASQYAAHAAAYALHIADPSAHHNKVTVGANLTLDDQLVNLGSKVVIDDATQALSNKTLLSPVFQDDFYIAYNGYDSWRMRIINGNLYTYAGDNLRSIIYAGEAGSGYFYQNDIRQISTNNAQHIISAGGGLANNYAYLYLDSRGSNAASGIWFRTNRGSGLRNQFVFQTVSDHLYLVRYAVADGAYQGLQWEINQDTGKFEQYGDMLVHGDFDADSLTTAGAVTALDVVASRYGKFQDGIVVGALDTPTAGYIADVRGKMLVSGGLDVGASLSVVGSGTFGAAVTGQDIIANRYGKFYNGAVFGALDTPGYPLDVRGDGHVSGNFGVDGDMVLAGQFNLPYWQFGEDGSLRSTDPAFTASPPKGIYLSPDGTFEAQNVRINGEFGAAVFSYDSTVLNNGAMMWTPGGAAKLQEDLLVAGVGTQVTVVVSRREHLNQPPPFLENHILFVSGMADRTYTHYEGTFSPFYEILPLATSVPNIQIQKADVWLDVDSFTSDDETWTYTCTVLRTSSIGVTIRAGTGVAGLEDTRTASVRPGYIKAVANDRFSPRMEFGYFSEEPWNDGWFPQILIGRRDIGPLVTSKEPGILIAQDATNPNSGFLTVDYDNFYAKNLGMDLSDGEGKFLSIQPDSGLNIYVPRHDEPHWSIGGDEGWTYWSPPETRRLSFICADDGHPMMEISSYVERTYYDEEMAQTSERVVSVIELDPDGRRSDGSLQIRSGSSFLQLNRSLTQLKGDIRAMIQAGDAEVAVFAGTGKVRLTGGLKWNKYPVGEDNVTVGDIFVDASDGALRMKLQ